MILVSSCKWYDVETCYDGVKEQSYISSWVSLLRSALRVPLSFNPKQRSVLCNSTIYHIYPQYILVPLTCNTLVLHTLIFQILYICTQGISNEFSSLILFYWRQLFVFSYVIPYIHLIMFISVTCTSSSSHFFDARHSSSCNKVGPTASCILWIRLLTLVIILVLISDGVEKLRLGLFGCYMMDSNGLGYIMLFTSRLFLLIQDKTFRYMMSFRTVKHWACNVEVM